MPEKKEEINEQILKDITKFKTVYKLCPLYNTPCNVVDAGVCVQCMHFKGLKSFSSDNNTFTEEILCGFRDIKKKTYEMSDAFLCVPLMATLF